MWDNLRVALKKYTKDKGMSLKAMRAYTRQLLIALQHIHRLEIIHADIKPDNILISEGHNMVKFCDLGTALETKDVAITPYLVSRFYRAPEIILGCEYSFPVDVFALGATLFELFTGKILFNSKSNNHALMKIMEVKGKCPKHCIKKGHLWKEHFDEGSLDFKYEDVDKYTKKSVSRVISDLAIKRDIFDMLVDRVGREKLTSEAKEDSQTIARIKQFADLLHQMLTIDPEKRITANDALAHPFLEDRLGKGVSASGDKNAANSRR
jgi:serine/threonine-protein kinase PRP4